LGSGYAVSGRGSLETSIFGSKEGRGKLISKAHERLGSAPRVADPKSTMIGKDEVGTPWLTHVNSDGNLPSVPTGETPEMRK